MTPGQLAKLYHAQFGRESLSHKGEYLRRKCSGLVDGFDGEVEPFS
jgi:hypothetical protein